MISTTSPKKQIPSSSSKRAIPTLILPYLLLHPLLSAAGFPGFSMDFVIIGNPGNAADAETEYGAVGRDYRIGKWEVSRRMIDAYNTNSGGPAINMADMTAFGGNGTNRPATGVSWNESARFVNWLNTSQGYSPAYKFATGGANDDISLWLPEDPGYNPENPFRNSKASYFLPSEDEWYKAAYYDPDANTGQGAYWDYATGSDSEPTAVTEGTASGTAVFGQAFSAGPADISNAGGLSPYGTMAQSGNVWEWGESGFMHPNDSAGESRAMRGGSWYFLSDNQSSSDRSDLAPSVRDPLLGFRIGSEMPPEIAVEHPAGNGLVSAEAAVDFGWIAIGTTSAQKSFTVVNTGMTNLTGLSVTIGGPAAADFAIDAVSLPVSLEPGASSAFNVSFFARSRGAGEATLQIASNDEDENPFTITLLGKGALPGTDDTIACGAFNIEFVSIESPGNAPDATGYGAVGHDYRISKHEVSREMVTAYNSLSGGAQITMANMAGYGGNNNNDRSFPATGVSWNEAARFVNWLNTSSGYSPAYKFTTAGANDNVEPWTPADGLAYDPSNPFRNPQAYYFLPGEDEWYKAAYFDSAVNGGSGGYWDYATGADSAPTAVVKGLAGGTAVYDGQRGLALMTHAGGLSPSGTMAQNGNAEEWCESLLNPPYVSPGEARVVRGGSWASSATTLTSSDRSGAITTSELVSYAFRVASHPSPDVPPVSPVTAADFLLDDYGDDGNFRAGNYTFYNAYNNPIEQWQLSNGRLRVYPGGKRTAGYMWNAGHKLASVGDRISIQVFENTNGAIGLHLDSDLEGPDGGKGVRFYEAGSLTVYPYEIRRYFFGPWGPAMPLSGAPSGALLLEVEVVRARASCMDLRAKLSGTGFTDIQRDFSMPSNELYFGIHAYSSYGGNSYYNICDNLTFSSPSLYWKWCEVHGLVPGVNDSLGDDPNGDGVINAMSFAFGAGPFPTGMASGRTRSTIHDTGEEGFLSLTIPVRTGTTFNGAGPLVSNLIDGVHYELQGTEELSGPWELGILEDAGIEAAGLPALGDINGDGFPDWEYRTFRLAQPVTGNPKGFMRAAIRTR
jgi:sulfatase modifying factor 1